MVARQRENWCVQLLIKIPPGAKFTKYIANGQATPLLKYRDPGFEEACFLACCQHVQYVKTYKLAYISDLQGKHRNGHAQGIDIGLGYGFTLTDPQIMSQESKGGLFGDGNVFEAFSQFEREHMCNEWCAWFGLEPFRVP